MQQLITVHSQGGVETVNARELHERLEVGKDFSTWIKDRIEKYGFSNGVDYLSVDGLSSPNPVSSKSRPQRTREYHLTIDMAKELAMVENNEQGRVVRRWFIEREQQLARREAIVPKDFASALRLAADQAEQIEAQRQQLAIMGPKADYFDTVASSKGAVRMIEVAKVLDVPGMGRNNLFTFLRAQGVLMADNLPYQNHIERGRFRVIQSSYKTGEGETVLTKTPLVTPKGIQFIKQLLETNGLLPRGGVA